MKWVEVRIGVRQNPMVCYPSQLEMVSGSGVAGPAASVGAVCDTTSGGGDTRLAFFANSGVSHLERMCVNHDGNVGIGG